MTTSANLSIEHMVTGEVDKETTFNDLVDAVDRVTTQYTSITVSTDATLTAAQAKYAFIEFVGAPGANRTIKLPTNKNYIFKNSVSGGFNIIVSGTGSGPATVTIPPGSIIEVFQEDDNELHAVSLGAELTAAYLLNGTIPTNMSGAVNVGSIGTTVKFVASAGGVTPFAIKAGSAPSVNVFEVQDNSNVAQFAINSSFEIDAKTHKIKNVVDPAAAQDAATKNYIDTNFATQTYVNTTFSYGHLQFAADTLTVSPGTVYYAWPCFITTAPGTNERWSIVHAAGKISKLRIIAAVAAAGGSVTFTVRKKTAGGGTGAGTDQTLTATLAIGATLVTDLVNSFTVAAGDEISVKIVENAGYSGSLARCIISMVHTFA